MANRFAAPTAAVPLMLELHECYATQLQKYYTSTLARHTAASVTPSEVSQISNVE
jgi:hypothetical protein